MDFNVMAIIAIGIAIAGVSVLRDIYRKRDEIFDSRFTPEDRSRVTQVAFFLLLPVSVALHELGHAVAVWSFGGEVIDFGFFFFAGFVSYQGFLTDVQQVLIAAAGTAVNILLAGLAMGVVLLKRPPLGAPWNELLVQFSILTIINALVFYPLLDLLTGMNADFRQMYFGGVPWLAAIIFVIHAGTLSGGYLLFKSDRFGSRLSELTGLPPHVRRDVLGGLKSVGQPSPRSRDSTPLQPHEALLRSAIARVGSGWPEPLRPALVRGPNGLSIAVVRWQGDGAQRAVSIMRAGAGQVAIVIPDRITANPEDAIKGQPWRQWSEMPSEDDLVLALRTAMEHADTTAVF